MLYKIYSLATDKTTELEAGTDIEVSGNTLYLNKPANIASCIMLKYSSIANLYGDLENISVAIHLKKESVSLRCLELYHRTVDVGELFDKILAKNAG